MKPFVMAIILGFARGVGSRITVAIPSFAGFIVAKRVGI